MFSLSIKKAFIFFILIASSAAIAKAVDRESFVVFKMDIDEDNLTDIVFIPEKRWTPIADIIINRNKRSALWFAGMSEGVFDSGGVWSGDIDMPISGALSPIVEDVSSDGLFDYVLQAESDQVASVVILQQEDESFTAEMQFFEIAGIPAHAGVAEMAVEMVGGSYRLTVRELLGWDGGHEPAQEGEYRFYRHDMDQDGYEDIVLLSSLISTVQDVVPVDVVRQYASWYRGKADGEYEALAAWQGDVLLDYTAALPLVTADLNGDGLQDVFLQSASEGLASLVLFGSPDGYFHIHQQIFEVDGVSLDAGSSQVSVQTFNGQSVLVVNGNQKLMMNQFGDYAYLENINIGPLPVLDITPSLVGLNNYRVDVSPTGAADIAIAISVPPGINGHAPDLSFRYDSQIGGGVMGVGWAISGVPAISRCPKIMAIDGIAVSRISYDASDRLCFGGSRLLDSSGVALSDADYWQAGNVFSPQNDHTTRVEVKSNSQGEIFFEVLGKHGKKMVFGETTDSRVKFGSSSMPAMWAVSSSKDMTVSAGDTITYHYDQDPVRGSYYPSYISYDGVRVDFSYGEGRKDAVWRYNGSYGQYEKRYLESVSVSQQTEGGWASYRNYRIQYDYAPKSNVMRLKKVYECGDQKCAPPYVADWTELSAYEPSPVTYDGSVIEGATSFLSSMSLSWPATGGKLVTHYHKSGQSRLVIQDLVSGSQAQDIGLASRYIGLVSADLNNDGYPELVGLKKIDSAWNATWEVIRLSPATDAENGHVSVSYGGVLYSTQYLSTGAYFSDGNSAPAAAFMDVDRDGRLDILIPDDDGWRLLRNGTSAKSSVFSFQNQGVLPGTPLSTHRHVITADLNGDQQSEVIWRAEDEWFAGTIASDFTLSEYEFDVALSAKNTLLIDINGDGLIDAADLSTGKIRYQINYGTGFTGIYTSAIDISAYRVALPSGIQRSSEEHHYVKVMDYNRDGLHDLLVRRTTSSKWQVLLSNGRGFESPISTTIDIVNVYGHSNDSIFTKITDIDGDSNPEVIQYSATASGSLYGYGWSIHQPVAPGARGIEVLLRYVFDSEQTFGAGFRPQQLIGLTDQHGGRTYLAYTPLSQYRLMANMGFGKKTWLDYVLNAEDLAAVPDDAMEMTAPIPAVVALVRPGRGVGAGHFFIYDTPYYSSQGRGFLGVRARATLQFDLDQIERWSSFISENDASNVELVNQFFSEFLGPQGSILTWSTRIESFYTSYPLSGRPKKIRDYKGDLTMAEIANIESTTQQVLEAAQASGNTQEYLAQVISESLFGEIVSMSSFEWDVEVKGASNYVTLSKRNDSTFTPLHADPLDVTTVDYVYDDWGNVTSSVSERRNANSQLLVVRTTVQNQYEYGLSSWMLGYLEGKTVTIETPVGIDVKTTAMPRNEGTRRPAFVHRFAGTESELFETFQYDANGNVTYRELHDPVSGVIRYEIYNDYAYSRYPGSSTNNLGHSASIAYKDVAGRVASETAPSGIVTSYEYDEFGRRTRVGTDTYQGQTAYRDIDYNIHGLDYSFVVTESGGGAPETRSYYDRVGMLAKQEIKLLDGSYSAVLKEYDNAGRILSETLPGSTQRSYSAYDKLGRQVFLSRPDGYSRVSSYSTSPTTGVTTLVTIEKDAKRLNGTGVAFSRTSVQESNALFQPVSVTDPLGTRIDNEYRADGLVDKTIVSYEESGQQVAAVYEFDYDAAGRRTSLMDPDTGETLSYYNALGDLDRTIDPAGRVTKYIYDDIGRLVQRIDDFGGLNPAFSFWAYDVVPSSDVAIQPGQQCGDGRVCASWNDAVGDDSYYEEYQYDPSGVVVSLHQVIGGRVFSVDKQYDQFNRHVLTQYPNGVVEKAAYNASHHLFQRGYCHDMSDCPGNGYIGTYVDAVNSFNSPTQLLYGNGIQSNLEYDPDSNRLASLSTGAQQQVQKLGYLWDGFGNMAERSNQRYVETLQQSLSVTEQFGYDQLDRLESINQAVVYSYDRFGNLRTKPGLDGQLEYDGSSGPHQVSHRSEAGSIVQSFQYDANGNMTSDGSRSLLYSPFNKPVQIVANGITKTFSYGPDRKRYRQVSQAADGTNVEVLYIQGGSYRETRITRPDGTESVRQDMVVAGVVQYRHGFDVVNGAEVNAVTEVQYLHYDALGSVDAVTDQAGQLVSASAFTPFGMRRDADWQSMQMLPLLDLEGMFSRVTDEGFTGHEMLDDAALVHMGGRVYDPVLGRFLSPDPYIQSPGNTQSYNRYSYVWNNPLKYTDPTGYTLDPLSSGYMSDYHLGGLDHLGSLQQWANNTSWQQTSSGTYYGGQLVATSSQVATAQSFNGNYYQPGSTTGSREAYTQVGGGASQTPDVPLVMADSSFPYMYACNGCDMQAAPEGGGEVGAQEGGIPSYDPSDPNYHEYVYDRAICTSSLNSNCTVSNVQYGSRLYPVPLAKGNVAVTTGDVSNAQIGLVRHVVDNETNTVVNITLSGKHMLDPGKVVRTVYQKGSVVFMRTYGDGVGNYGGLNSSIVNVDLVWGGVNRDITRYINSLP